jgi:DNA polymerase-3 subunit alpha
MLAVLEQAQAAGQKAQQDAIIGQGSIFDGLGLDLGGGSGSSAAEAFATPSHAPIPTEEFERAELLAAEKESIGLFISAHPLKEVRAALNAKVDCTLGELSSRRDGDWVTVGGMITQAKKIRTKKGDHMMFATLDDLESAVEILVFGKALADNEAALAVDTIVTVRGRVDHKDREKTCVVAQAVECFEPSEEEVRRAEEEAAKVLVPPTALKLCLDAAALPAGVLVDLKDVLCGFPGECDVVIELCTSAGNRKLRLGPKFRVERTASLHAELDALLGRAIVNPAAAAAAVAVSASAEDETGREPASEAAAGAVVSEPAAGAAISAG